MSGPCNTVSMNEFDGRKIDRKTLEKLPIRAAKRVASEKIPGLSSKRLPRPGKARLFWRVICRSPCNRRTQRPTRPPSFAVQVTLPGGSTLSQTCRSSSTPSIPASVAKPPVAPCPCLALPIRNSILMKPLFSNTCSCQIRN